MKNALISFLMGMFVGGGGVWYLSEDGPSPRLQDVGRRMEAAADNASETGATTARRARDILDAKLEALELDPVKINDEMTRTGRVVRRRTRELGQIVAEAAIDARITASIKASLLRDPELSAWDISVSTTDGRVTLSGNVHSAEQSGRAILVAYQTDGVREVLSTLRVTEQR